MPVQYGVGRVPLAEGLQGPEDVPQAVPPTEHVGDGRPVLGDMKLSHGPL